MSFIGFAAAVSSMVSFYSKQISPFETKVHFKVNINNAQEEELVKLNGIGPALARRIIKYRKYYGEFQKIDDIKKIYGIGDNKFEQIKDFLTVD